MDDADSRAVTDSPIDWVAKHIQQYVDSEGKQGHHFLGYDALLLTTRGRKSGKLRRTALYYGRDGDRYLLVASDSGSRTHPSWYLNLTENPDVEVQIGADKFTAHARTATPVERPPLWDLMATIFPTYNTYQATTGREIPVVLLEPTAD